MKYRNKPSTVEAKQWFKHGDHKDIVPYTMHSFPTEICKPCGIPFSEHGHHEDNIRGCFVVHPGNWILTHEDGTITKCGAVAFEAMYERIDN